MWFRQPLSIIKKGLPLAAALAMMATVPPASADEPGRDAEADIRLALKHLDQDPPEVEAARSVLEDALSEVYGEAGDRDARPVYRVGPAYPPLAASEGLEGNCSFRFDVDAQGEILALRFLDCPKAFRDATRFAVSQWRYAPKLIDGKPVIRRGIISSFEFELADGDEAGG